jgi:hypothetical protein
MAAKRKGQPYFEVGRAKFPLIQSDQFKQSDVKLIAAVTGMEWLDWCKLLAKHSLSHARVMQGFFAVAVQRARQATLEEVEAFIDDLPLVDGIKFVVPDPPKGDASPPAEDETAGT